jgi:hypothetical protein
MFCHTVVIENVCGPPRQAHQGVPTAGFSATSKMRVNLFVAISDAEIILSDWDRPGAASGGRRPRLMGCRSKTRSPGPFSAGDIRSTVWRHR